MQVFDMLKDIPMYSEWSKIQPVDKGWSSDKKFYIEDIMGRKLLLRVADIKEFDNKKKEFEFVTKISEMDISMSMPIDFGTCSDDKYAYILYSWVEGDDAESILPKLSKEKQYQLGIKAGEALRKIHSIPAHDTVIDWYTRYERKIRHKLEMYEKSPIKAPNDSKFIDFIEMNIPYLKGRPQVLHHGDFHVGNLVITPDEEIGVIDFNRYDVGDPWEEFNRCVFSWSISVPFTVGQIHGYFNDLIPDDFFRLMALYIATNTISSIPWAIPFGEEDVKTMLDNAKKVIDTYNHFETYIPSWYTEYSKRRN